MSTQSDSRVDSKADSKADPIGIRKYDFIEFYVGSAKMTAYWYAKIFGLDITAYLGPETGIRDTVSFYLTKNDLKFVITGPAQPGNFEVWGFVQKHGDGVKRWAIEVDDVTSAFNHATSRQFDSATQ